MTIIEAIQEFLIACRANGGRPATIKWYTSLMQEFAARLGEREAASVTATVTREHGALTVAGVNQILKRLKKRADVRGRVNPHAFRHNFARCYLTNGGDVITLAKLLGHADVNTTAAYYAVFSPDELAELHEKYSPMKNLRGLR